MTQFSNEDKIKKYEELLHAIDMAAQTANDSRLAELLQNICRWSYSHRSGEVTDEERTARINDALSSLLETRGLKHGTLQSHINQAWLLLYDAKCNNENPFVIDAWNVEREIFLKNFKGFIKGGDKLLEEKQKQKTSVFKFNYYDNVTLHHEVYMNLPLEKCSTTGQIIDRFIDDFGDNYYEVALQANDFSTTLVTCKEDEIEYATGNKT